MSTNPDILVMFTPGEVEKVTGLSTVAQRNLRRHGYLPVTDGAHPRYNIFDMSKLMVLKLFSDHGLGPSKSLKIAEICAIGIAYAALQERGAYSGSSDFETQSFSKNIIREYTGNGVVPARYFIRWADGTHTFHRSLDDAFFPFELQDVQISGPVTVLDLHALGSGLLMKIGKPVVEGF